MPLFINLCSIVWFRQLSILEQLDLNNIYYSINMSSNSQPSQKLRRNGSPSTNKSTGPLRATIPVSLMTQSVILDVPEDPHHTNLSQNAWIKANSPLAVLGAGSTLQSGISKPSPWRLKQWSPTPKGIYR